MKILFIKKRNFFYLFFIVLLILTCFFFMRYSPSFAVDLAMSSFFNIDVATTLNDISKSDEKKAYLTFDDGPTTKATGQILDVLKEEDVKATFFVVGKHVKENPELVKDALTVLHDMDYVYVDWNCLNRDSERKYSNAQLLNNLKKTAKNKGTLIILMHDTADVNETYDVLKDSISYLKSQGYEFRNFYDFVNH